MKRNPLISRAERLLRHFMAYHLSASMPYYIVAEHPKSGGSWVGQMLAEYFDVPFPRNRFPRLGSSILHGHYMRDDRLKNVFLVVRDGRDVMASWYHHCLFVNDRYNERLVLRMRKALPFSDYDDVKSNMPAFLEYHFAQKKPLGFNWAEFIDSWWGMVPSVIRYESLLDDAVKELAASITAVLGEAVDINRLGEIVAANSFERQAGRRSGEEEKESFLRKGIAGDWRNCFDQEACQIFDHYAGDALICLGYEPDREWTHNDI